MMKIMIAVVLALIALTSASSRGVFRENWSNLKTFEDGQSRQRLWECLTEEQNSVDYECFSISTGWFKGFATRNFYTCLGSPDAINMKMNYDSHQDEESKEGCRAIQMKLMRGFYSDCIVSRSGVKNDTTGEFDFEKLKKMTIGLSKLSSWQKTAAYATFDSCMISHKSVPYQKYNIDHDTLSASLHDYISRSNRVFRIGTLSPTSSMMAVDCIKTALLHNGCADKISEETMVKVLTGLKSIEGSE